MIPIKNISIILLLVKKLVPALLVKSVLLNIKYRIKMSQLKSYKKTK
jgi:hypothetical protein